MPYRIQIIKAMAFALVVLYLVSVNISRWKNREMAKLPKSPICTTLSAKGRAIILEIQLV
jgi:hypothetical protein